MQQTIFILQCTCTVHTIWAAYVLTSTVLVGCLGFERGNINQNSSANVHLSQILLDRNCVSKNELPKSDCVPNLYKIQFAYGSAATVSIYATFPSEAVA